MQPNEIANRIWTIAWDGPPELARDLQREWRLVAIRWPAILFVGIALPFVHLAPPRLFTAYLVLCVATIYNAGLTLAFRRWPWLIRRGYVSNLADAGLNLAMIWIAGGFETPFYFVIYTVTIAAAIRYGYGPALAMALLFVGCDLATIVLTMRSPDAAFLFRSGFLCLTAVLAGLLHEQARRAEAALEHRVVELQHAYSDLAVAHQELLSVDEMKSTFLANVSHELRTPLTSILAYSELLFNFRPEEDEAVEFAHIINQESERLTRLVNDVLDLAKMESGQMQFRMTGIDVSALVRDVARVFGPLVKEHNLRFACAVEDDLRCISDGDRLVQLLTNLLNNALKFTASGSIELRAVSQDDQILISVSDTGIGIAPDHQARIFEPFQQVGDTLTSRPKGTGLGLAICRDIVEQHHGRLWVESSPGEGSAFWVALPLESSEVAVAA